VVGAIVGGRDQVKTLLAWVIMHKLKHSTVIIIIMIMIMIIMIMS
jgi:hypothetical protein